MYEYVYEYGGKWPYSYTYSYTRILFLSKAERTVVRS